MSNSVKERSEIVCREDKTSAYEANLGQRDGNQDEGTKSRSHDNGT